MKIVCAWCKKNMGEKNGRGVKGVTHGICKQCFDKFMAKVESNIGAGEEEVKRLLQAVYKPESAPPGFKESLLKRLLEKAKGKV